MQKVIMALICLMSMNTLASGEHLEALYGISRYENTIKVKVRSYGCTRASSFAINTTEKGLAIVRIKPDNCRRMPHVIEVTLPLPKETGAFVLLNPFAGLS